MNDLYDYIGLLEEILNSFGVSFTLCDNLSFDLLLKDFW